MTSKRKLVNFVRESGKDNFGEEPYVEKKLHLGKRADLSGLEARTFYEGLLRHDDKQSEPYVQQIGRAKCESKSQALPRKGRCKRSRKLTDKCSKNSRKCERKPENPVPGRPEKQSRTVCSDESTSRLGFHLLKLAQNGDLDGVKRQLELGIDVQFQDLYGWTSLMCAAYSGHHKVVQCLLKGGANPDIRDKMGKSARELAQSRRHSDVIVVLDQHCSSPQQSDEDHQPDVKKTVPFHCDICNVDFTNTSVERHNASTLHIFNSKLKPKVTSYFIPESNRGFQMMVKHGWDTEKGLGPKGWGQKFPVKTVLKQDRHGLGAKVEVKPRVTHFSANDTAAVVRSKPEREMKSSTLSKRKQIKKQSKEREWERKLRIYMNTD